MFDDTWPAQVPHFSLALLVLVQGCAVLWGEQLLLHFCHQSLLPSLHRSCCSGFSMVFSSANQGFFSSSEMSRRWHLYSVMIIPFWLWQPLSCLSVLLSVHVNLRVILDPPEHPKEHLPTTDPFPWRCWFSTLRFSLYPFLSLPNFPSLNRLPKICSSVPQFSSLCSLSVG